MTDYCMPAGLTNVSTSYPKLGLSGCCGTAAIQRHMGRQADLPPRGRLSSPKMGPLTLTDGSNLNPMAGVRTGEIIMFLMSLGT